MLRFLIVLFFVFIKANNKQFYTITIYQLEDCSFCRYTEKKLKNIIEEKQFSDLVQLEIIKCEQKGEECRDNLNPPNIQFKDKDGNYLGEANGIKTTMFYKQWISKLISQQIQSIELIRTKKQSYLVQEFKNEEKVMGYFTYSSTKEHSDEDKVSFEFAEEKQEAKQISMIKISPLQIFGVISCIFLTGIFIWIIRPAKKTIEYNPIEFSESEILPSENQS